MAGCPHCYHIFWDGRSGPPRGGLAVSQVLHLVVFCAYPSIIGFFVRAPSAGVSLFSPQTSFILYFCLSLVWGEGHDQPLLFLYCLSFRFFVGLRLAHLPSARIRPFLRFGRFAAFFIDLGGLG